MRCECCSTSKDVHSMATGGRYRAELCGHCAQGGHGMDRCLLCGAPTWRCRWLAHFSDVHPLMLQKLVNEPQHHFEPPPSPTHRLGTLRFGPGGALPGSDD